MARGWESKSIEEQQAAALQRQPSGVKISPEQAALTRKVEGLRLSRQRVLQQLQNAQDPRLRQMLELAVDDLDHQIAAAQS